MRYCAVCKNKYPSGSKNLFFVPKDPEKRAKWGEICGRNFTPTNSICIDHFLERCIVRAGKRVFLLPSAEPTYKLSTETINASSYDLRWEQLNPPTESNNLDVCNMSSSDNSGTSKKGRLFSCTQHTNTAIQSSRKENIKKKNSNNGLSKHMVLENNKKVLKKKLLNRDKRVMPPQLEEPVVQMPVVKSVSCSGYTQTNIRLCGLVEASDFADEFRFNCFYCTKVFSLEKWKSFINHIKESHFKDEEAFKTAEYLSKDHDYTPISVPPPITAKNSLEPIVFNPVSASSSLADPLGSLHNPFESIVFNSNLCCTPYKSDTNAIPFNNLATYSKRKLKSSKRFYSKITEHQKSKKSALSRCLKRTVEAVIKPAMILPPVDVECYDATHPFVANQEDSTEISFEYTPRPIVDLLLDNIKSFPVLWQYDTQPFNEDFYEATEELCNVINTKFSLNIDNLKMRRSINRILRFYCYIFPNECNDEFTYYYDKCDSFLPSVNEIAYARCSHCYVCYDSDFNLKLHLVEEQKYLEWPYKCAQCKECFRLCDEFEFHKRLPHFDEVFRCQPCKVSFFRRLTYKKHMVEEHNKVSEPGMFKCDICDKRLETINGLRSHKSAHGEAPHKCHLCPKAFHAKSKLALHLKMHRKEPDFMCEICGMKFFTQPSLRVHMTKHTGEKVTCKICNLRLRKSSLKRHLRIVHVPYAGLIAKRFLNSNGKQIRLGRRSNARSNMPRSKRKYNCKICNVSFDNYKLVVLHNKEMHSDLPRWPCILCTSELGAKINLRIHYRNKHKLHPLQVYKLMEENEELSNVLSMEVDDIEESLDTSISSKIKPKNTTKTDIKSPTKTDLLPDEIYFAEENVHSSTIQDEIMKAVNDIETQDIKIDYMNDMFTDFLE